MFKCSYVLMMVLVIVVIIAVSQKEQIKNRGSAFLTKVMEQREMFESPTAPIIVSNERPSKESDKTEMATAHDPNQYVISEYSNQDVIETEYHTDIIMYDVPELYNEDNYTDLYTLKKDGTDTEKLADMERAFDEVQSDSMYKHIELYKTRGGNRV